MAANNFYLALTMAQLDTINNENVVGTTTINAGPAQGTAAEIELRIMTDPGSGANKITRRHVVVALNQLKAYVESGGSAHAGAFLPGL